MRRLALLLTGLAILAAINVTVWRYERAMSSGEVVGEVPGLQSVATAIGTPARRSASTGGSRVSRSA